MDPDPDPEPDPNWPKIMDSDPNSMYLDPQHNTAKANKSHNYDHFVPTVNFVSSFLIGGGGGGSEQC